LTERQALNPAFPENAPRQSGERHLPTTMAEPTSAGSAGRRPSRQCESLLSFNATGEDQHPGKLFGLTRLAFSEPSFPANGREDVNLGENRSAAILSVRFRRLTVRRRLRIDHWTSQLMPDGDAKGTQGPLWAKGAAIIASASVSAWFVCSFGSADRLRSDDKKRQGRVPRAKCLGDVAAALAACFKTSLRGEPEATLRRGPPPASAAENGRRRVHPASRRLISKHAVQASGQKCGAHANRAALLRSINRRGKPPGTEPRIFRRRG